MALSSAGLVARAAALRPGQTQPVVHTPQSQYPTLGQPNAPLALLYWAPLRNDATKLVLPLLKQMVARFPGKVRISFLSRYRQGTYYTPEKYAAIVGREAYSQGGDRLFFRFYEGLCSQQSLYMLSEAMVNQVARSAGLNMNRLQAAVTQSLHAKAVREEDALTTQIGIPAYNSAPLLLIGDERYYISQWTQLQHVDQVIRRQILAAEQWQRQGLSAGQMDERFFAQARKRYPPWRPYVSPHAVSPQFSRSSKRYALPVGTSPVKGPADATVTVVAFLDFTDYLSFNAWTTLQALLATYPKQLRVVFKAMPRRVQTNALEAAKAAQVAHSQGKFWELALIFFQNRWRLYPTALPQLVQQAGLDVQRYVRDARDPAVSRRVAADMQLGRTSGVGNPPALFINGRRVLSRTFSQLEIEPIVKEELRGGLLTRLFGS
jgi:protein-disulfide isomerase